ncbi:hypothetical protein GIB67_022621 [Kingdonia uniflora]|uniref:SHSP domain-containing protein n=1 Tax=Kingdonia uniflora TaxID=39325 RepID=A0A7J7P866_9MAGN|nr:hypothetical protein GIB67_022621 [Kingdonia uniflora]
MSSMVPWFGTPFSSDVWDFGGNWPPRRREGEGGGDNDPASVITRTNVDWKEEVKVEVEDGNMLKISGEHTKEEEDKNDKWHRLERRHGSFMRRFRLPENAKVYEIKCGLENGVLTVVVPKKESEQEKAKNVRSIDIA